MRFRPLYLLLVVLVGATARAAEPDTSKVVLDDGNTIIANQTIVFTLPAKQVPSTKMVDGPLLGNGDVGVVIAGTPDQLRFYIGKNDFWGMRTLAPMTVGHLELIAPLLKGASFREEEDLQNAEIRGEFASASGSLSICAWVDANANQLIVSLTNRGNAPLPIAVKMHEGDIALEPQPASEDAFLYDPDRTSDSRKIAVTTRLLRAGADDSKAREADLAPGETAVVAAIILSDLDAKDPLAEARSQESELTLATIGQTKAKHREWWTNYWSRSFIEIPDKTIEQEWYVSQYVMDSCSRAGKVAPGLWGNWITCDNTAWHGDYHLNYNFEAPYYGVFAGNHADVSLPFYQAILQFMPDGRKIAKGHGWKGVHYPVGIGPWGMNIYDGKDWGQRSDAAFFALNFISYYQSTRDQKFLKETAYPFLREVADFWEDYLKFENGRYVIYNDSIHEKSGADMNPLLSLGLVRTLFKNMVSMSEDLGVDADRRAKWQDIVQKISEFPTQQRGGKTVFRYSEKGMAWANGNTLGIHHIFPASAIGLDSDPKLLEICRNTIDAMGRWNDNNGSSSWYTACARVGYDPASILAHMRQMCDKHLMPNKVLHFGGGGIENVSAFHAVTEMLFQSHEGVLRLFPCWPKDQDARFGTLRGYGAFLVSAELKAGVVSGVTIHSEAGCKCTIVNPWPGETVRLTRDGKPAEELVGDRFSFPTSAGEQLQLSVLPTPTTR